MFGEGGGGINVGILLSKCGLLSCMAVIHMD